jgi:periplasmic protein TonB
MRRFVLLSFGLHAAVLGGALIWLSEGAPVRDAPDTEGAVELVMLEQQGQGTTTAPPTPAAAAATPVPDTPPPATEAPAVPPPLPPPPPPPPVDTAVVEPLPVPLPPPPPMPPTPTPQQAQPVAPPPRAAAPPRQRPIEAPEINLGGTDSETNAIVSGDHVVPASVDSKFHNKAPIYPPEAARRSEQGAVILLIHVSPDGLPAGVEVLQGSGYVLLDRAARDAVQAWHFLPAVKDGAPIPFDMKLRVVFHLD